MTEAEVRRIAHEAATCAVKATFTALGVDMSKPAAVIEAQRDFAWLRGRRLLEGKVGTKAILTVATIIIASVAAAIWVIATGRSGQ